MEKGSGRRCCHVCGRGLAGTIIMTSEIEKKISANKLAVNKRLHF